MRLTSLVKRSFLGICFLAYSFGANAQTHPALGGGTGTSTDPYQIQTPDHLKQLAGFVNAGTVNGEVRPKVYYILINNLDLSAYAAGEGWIPIGGSYTGNYSSYFNGNFNGNGKKITNLKINRPEKQCQGLFGLTYAWSTIENLGIENCDVTGFGEVGGLVGYNSSSISNCYVTGNVSGAGGWYVGGLVGDDRSKSTVSNCNSTVNVSGADGYVGGLMGYSYDSDILNCYATGNVSGGSNVGGLVGLADGSASFSNCYATGNVVGLWRVGGLVGEGAFCRISNCYATGNVSGISNSYGDGIDVGGLVGRSYTSNISYCYAAGNVSGNLQVGGLVGNNYVNTAVIRNCVALNDSVVSTANTTSINRICGYNEGVLYNNYALSTMVVKDSNGNVTITDTLKGSAGMGKSIDTLQKLAFYTDVANWKDNAWSIDSATAIWKICDGKSLPFLRWQGINCNGESVVYTITATAGTGGSISPSGTISVEEGKDTTFTFSANSGYQIVQVFIDDTNNSSAVATGTYTFTNVSANHKIEVSFKPTTGISEVTAEKIQIYPNPTSGQVRVSGDIWDSKDRNIIIYDVVGQVVFTSQLSKLSPETTIDISHLANGLYFLKVGGKTVKVIKE